jgi:hypothetical protein
LRGSYDLEGDDAVPVNFTIPLTTFQPGSHTVGPASVPAGDSRVTLTVDRTVTGGLNSLGGSSELHMEAQLSGDGGATWHAVDTDQPGTATAWGTPGGPITWTDKQGVVHTYTASSGTWPIFPGTGRQVRAVITVTGPAPIAVSGSIVTA